MNEWAATKLNLSEPVSMIANELLVEREPASANANAPVAIREHVTVVPSDQLIIVDGEVLFFSFDAPEHLHALQWHQGKGHMEWNNDWNHPLFPSDYEADVKPFVLAWEQEKERVSRKSVAEA